MPELPEVETTRLSITELIGQKIRKIQIYQPILREVILDEIYSLTNQGIESIERRSKYLIFRTNKGDILIHLGMSGFFKLFSPNSPIKPHIHDRVDFYFEDCILRFNDMRRFGLIQFHQNAYQSKQILNLGIEPFDENFDASYLKAKLKKTRVSIKQSLMNAKIVVGVGNIYASEVLFLSNIHPLKMSGKITTLECQKLVEFIQKVLIRAIKNGGTTLKDFKQTDGKMGYFQQYLNVYNRKNKPCYVCSSLIEVTKIYSRSSYFCPKCQKR